MNYVEFGKTTLEVQDGFTPLDIQNKQFRKVLRGIVRKKSMSLCHVF